MRRFQKKPEVTFAVIPGVGRLGAGQILEGDHFAKFVPSLLVELPALTATAPTPPAVIVLPAEPPPAPTAPPPPPPSAPARPPVTMADAGFVSPEELVAAVDEENKQTQVQIEQAVARLDPVEESKKKEAPKEVPKPKPGLGKKPSGRK